MHNTSLLIPLIFLYSLHFMKYFHSILTVDNGGPTTAAAATESFFSLGFLKSFDLGSKSFSLSDDSVWVWGWNVVVMNGIRRGSITKHFSFLATATAPQNPS